MQLDTSVWIAIVAGIVSIITLIIQTNNTQQLARINKKQDDHTTALAVTNDKVDTNITKTDKVETLVNSEHDKLMAQVKRLEEINGLLTGAATERARLDNKAEAAANIEVAYKSGQEYGSRYLAPAETPVVPVPGVTNIVDKQFVNNQTVEPKKEG